MAADANVHGKNAVTGKGATPKTPGNAGMGNSNHVPVIGKPQPGASGYVSDQQQQQ
jgi:hypothetical protein